MAPLPTHRRPMPPWPWMWVALVCLPPSALLARTTEPALLDGWMVDRWTVDDGLPLDHVRDMAIDTDGFVWFATFDGLARFDGQSFHVLRRGNVPELPANRLPFVEADPRGGLWVLSEFGDLIRLADGNVTSIPKVPGGVLNRFETLAGEVYAYGGSGLFRLDRDGPKKLADASPEGRITSVDRSPDGTLWFTDELDGLIQLRDSGPKNLGGSSKSWIVTHLPDGRRLMGTDTELLFVGPDGLTVPLPGGPTTSRVCEVSVDRDSSLLIRTQDTWYRDRLDHPIGTVSRTTCGSHAMSIGGRWRATANQILLDGLAIAESSDAVVGIAQQGHAIWAITDGAGVLRVRPRLVTPQAPRGATESDLILSLLAEQNGQAWVGTFAKGAWRMLPEPLRIDTGPDWRRNNTTSLARGPDGQVWVGNDYGVCRVVDTGCEYVLHDKTEVRALHPDRQGQLWAGSSDGLFRDVSGVPREVLAPDGRIIGARVIVDGRPGELWVGTGSQGIAQVNGEAIRRWDFDDGLSSNRIRSFFVDGDHVWAGTGDGGVCRIDTASDAISCITTEQGLHDDCIHAMLPDDTGRLWMSTNRGVFWVDRAALHAVADGKQDTVQSVVLGEQHGMRDREGNGGQGSVAGTDSQGRMWFATQDGVAIVDPRDVPVPEAPVVHLEEAWVDGRRVPVNGDLDLSPDQRQLKVRWTAAEMEWPDDVRYRFRLSPHDSAWRGPTTDQEANWLELPPGPFSVEVQASLAGSWSPTRVLAGVRRPAFTETPWYIATLLAFALTTLGTTMWWRGRAQRQRQIELEGEVRRRTAGLESTTRELVIQNEEIALRNREIASQARRLEELDALRKRLVADLSHELRTPLALVAGPLQDLADNAPNLSPSNHQRLDVVQRSVSRLQDLIGQLFDLTRLEHGRLPLRARSADLAALLRAVLTGFARPLSDAGLALHSDVTGAHWVYFDADLIEKVVGNLLSNALKFTPKGGSVTVTLLARSEHVRVEITDTGIGVPPQATAHLFDRFYQADQGDQRRFGGAGIGLALCRELVELHGGSIGVESAENTGSTFWFELPRGVAHLAPSDIDTSSPTAAPRSREPEQHPPHEGPVTVLVVEDHPDMREYLAAHLSSHFQVREAADGHAALAQVRAHRPDAIVSDVMMPGMDGLELTRTLKEHHDTSSIPVVLVSAKATEEDRSAGLEVADAYLSKPVRMRELLETVARLMGTSLQSAAAQSEVPEADLQLRRRLLEVTRTHLDQSGFGVKELAGHLAMSPRQLQRTLQRLMGMSPSEFLRAERMEEAQTLLSSGAYTTTAEVAAQVGLSPSYFSRLYSNWFGHPPTDDLPGTRKA